MQSFRQIEVMTPVDGARARIYHCHEVRFEASIDNCRPEPVRSGALVW